jgi:hypothetical protein
MWYSVRLSLSRIIFAPYDHPDTMKLYTRAHGAKVCGIDNRSCQNIVSCTWQTTNLIINLDHDEWIIDDDNMVLAYLGFGKTGCHAHSTHPYVPCRERNGSEPLQS